MSYLAARHRHRPPPAVERGELEAVPAQQARLEGVNLKWKREGEAVDSGLPKFNTRAPATPTLHCCETVGPASPLGRGKPCLRTLCLRQGWAE